MLSLLVALAVQAADPLTSLTVKVGERSSSVPVVVTDQGLAVRADLLADALGGTLRAAAGGEWMLEVGELSLELETRSPFVRARDEAHPIAFAPSMRGGRMYVPFSMATELMPRLASGFTYDAKRVELRRFAPVTASRPRPDAGAERGPARASPRERRRVIVDAGHGGPDRGMSGPIGSSRKIFEKDITLQVARLVRDQLRERGVDVVMTRDRDTLIALADRGRIANRSRGDLFLSIHVNAANPRWTNPGAARGFETYFLSEARTDDARRVEQMENEVVKYEIATPEEAPDALSFILHDMEQNEHLRESSVLADVVQREMARIHPGPNRGVKQAGFRVLVTALMPAVLIEIGFGTNAAEARFIGESAGQERLAKAIADGAVEYLAQYERRAGAGSGR